MADVCDAAGADQTTCQPESRILDCCWLSANPTLGRAALQCAQYAGDYTDPSKLQWLFAVALPTMALMAFGIGANDAANSWGTSVGSGAVPLKWALIVGGVMDALGAITLGAGASAPRASGASIQVAL